ncbi:MAG: glycoside hydrolase family 3 C-terminal domain-containing protein [Firmicutes bacterium]|nr:glycoside hydrolase family 3 C-terminal domain-containing protein [Bacillota bacterium]
MKKTKLGVLIMALLVATVMVAGACGPTKVVKQTALAKPVITVPVTGDTSIAWSSVQNAAEYDVMIDSKTQSSTGTSVDVSKLDDGAHRMLVRAVPDAKSKEYKNSDWSNAVDFSIVSGKVGTASQGNPENPDPNNPNQSDPGQKYPKPTPTSVDNPLFKNELSQALATEGIVLLKNGTNNNIIPLDVAAGETKLSVFGWSASDAGWVLGGTGSGGGSSAGAKKLRAALTDTEASLKAAYPNSGEFGPAFAVHEELFTLSQNFRNNRPASGIDANQYDRHFNLCEPTISADVMTRARTHSDVAVVVIGRQGGESLDLPRDYQYVQSAAGSGAAPSNTQVRDRHYLQLSTQEETLLTQIGTAKFSKVILIMNTCNVFQLDFLDNPAYGIDAVLQVGAPGGVGALGVRKILNGAAYASGRTVDTYPKNLSKDPSFNNSVRLGVVNTGGNNHMEYREDIYVGYRYYETAAKDGKIVYENEVVYPFGFGLSNTKFDWTVKKVEPAANTAIAMNTSFQIQVDVKNTGTLPGQDVVQVYVTAPADPLVPGIEKPHVVLVSYAKTGLLAPGQTETLALDFEAYDFASYDCYDANKNGFSGYELDSGSYQIKLQTDSHTIKTDAAGAGATAGVITYTCTGSKLDYDRTFKDLANNTRPLAQPRNYFTNTDADKAANKYYFGIPIDGSLGNNEVVGTTGGGATASNKIPFMSRYGSTPFTQPVRMTRSGLGYSLPNSSAQGPGNNIPVPIDASSQNGTLNWNSTAFAIEGSAVFTRPTAKNTVNGVSNGATIMSGNKLTAMGLEAGANWDSPVWDTLLDRTTLDEQRRFVSDGNYFTRNIGSIGKPQMSDKDGPSGYGGMGPNVPNATMFPVETVIAQTWSHKLAYNFGLAIGREGRAGGVGGWYAPATNMHRSAFGGRNFEYFSEDPHIAGMMSADISRAVIVNGVYVYVKHFVANETETSRGGLRTWMSEQALREIYLKPFELAVVRGHASGIMNSFNFLGAVWTGGSAALQNNIVWGEWGFRGAICTDYCGWYGDASDHMNIRTAMRAMNSLWIGSNGPWNQGSGGAAAPTNDATINALMRRATKQNLYALANAWWYEEMYGGGEKYDTSFFGRTLS